MAEFVLIPYDLSKSLQTLYLDQSEYVKKGRCGDLLPSFILENFLGICNEVFDRAEMTPEDVKVSPLLRLHRADNGDHFGIYAYNININLPIQKPNIRATCLAMACGLHTSRFQGDVFISKLGYDQNQQIMNMDISEKEIRYGCISPDIRKDIISSLLVMKQQDGENEQKANDFETISIPSWLANAAKFNYEDTSALEALAEVMNKNAVLDQTDTSSDEEESLASDDSTENDQICQEEPKNFIAKQSLCLHCRGNCDNPCKTCEGAYFCLEPRLCSKAGWSHQCLCLTWKLYTQRREELSTFCFDKWYIPLVGRSFQLSDTPYESFLVNELGVLDKNMNSWWTTEINGWSGGLSGSAKTVNALKRLTYMEGFRLDGDKIPPERRVTPDDWIGTVKTDECRLLNLDSWDDYYKVRHIPLSSPVALLLTFPLTIYHAIRMHGAVPVTVAKMLHRPLRLHVVGIEKELNMIDIFKEVGYLLPKDLKLELVFIVRKDMLPPKCHEIESRSRNGCDIEIKLLDNLTIILKSGSYCHDLDPKFDCGTGPPDMIIGMNAGIFAYKSWRNVVAFLNSKQNRGIVGVFTDYNEHSGVNCASLGGGISRESMHINPFRQPRAMSVFSMNLPQFSNGFMYVFNEQELDV